MKKYKKILSLFLLIMMIIFTGCAGGDKSSKLNLSDIQIEGDLKVHYIDVGQADSILIEQEGHYMLIDAGNNEDSKTVVKYLKNNGVKKLEYVIGTHPHEDHIGSLDVVIDTFDIGKVIMPKKAHTTKTYKDVIKAIKNKNLKITVPKVGDTFMLGDAEITVLGPNGKDHKDLNDYSVVVKLQFGESSFMFTGDAEEASEKDIIKTGLNIKSDVLKSGHHGSRSSSSDAFLNKVKPEYVVISCGVDNDYGHPHKETMDKYTKKGYKVYRTDKMGTILAITDGKEIVFKTEKGGELQDKVEPEEQIQEIDTEDISIEILKVDKKGELVYLKNTGEEDVNLKGLTLLSVRGEQKYEFDSFKIKAGATITISSGEISGDLKWNQKNVWNNSEEDEAQLLDYNGKIISKYK